MTDGELICLIALSSMLVALFADHIFFVMASRMLNKAMKSGAGWVRITENGKNHD